MINDDILGDIKAQPQVDWNLIKNILSEIIKVLKNIIGMVDENKITIILSSVITILEFLRERIADDDTNRSEDHDRK